MPMVLGVKVILVKVLEIRTSVLAKVKWIIVVWITA